MFDSKSWHCPLCQYRNPYDKNLLQGRYATSIERSRCEECLYPNIVLDMPLSEMKYRFTRVVTRRKSVPYSNHSREVLVLVIDCTAYPTYLNYVKSLLVKLVEHYHSEADIRTFCTTLVS